MKRREKFLPTLIGILFVAFFLSVFFIDIPKVRFVVTSLENWSYDLDVRNRYHPLPKNSPITIIDIDDQSLAEVGRWPWPRNKFAQMVNQARKLGGAQIIFDVTFPISEENIVTTVESALNQNGATSIISALDAIKPEFDYDAQFAKSLQAQPTILGFVFSDTEKPEGLLPAPLTTLPPDLVDQLGIAEVNGYIGNLPLLQEAAKNGAFINSTPDRDGVLRSSPILLRRGNDIYPSLGLAAAIAYLKPQNIGLITHKYEGVAVLEGLQLDNVTIPTDPWGRILIPFRGPPYTFSYVSAIDLLKGNVKPESIANKILFFGSTATGASDLRATSMAPVFAGVEVHTSITSGILDQYLPFRPAWAKGMTLTVIALVGLLCAFVFPQVGPLTSFIAALLFTGILMSVDRWIWFHYTLVFDTFFPIFVLQVLFVFNLIYGYLAESKRKQEIKSIFGQYVSPDHIDQMLGTSGKLNLEGESKEMSVLFADIFGFTHLSEKMSANQLKQTLNHFFTPMTEVIFKHLGTIDKYVGDMVMAFWGAPIENLQHAKASVATAMEMQKRLRDLNIEFQKEQKPELKIGVGINTGVMNVGDMGSEFRRAYTVISDAVNLASRLEGLTRFYRVGIIVGENTWEKTKGDFIYRKLDRVKVKGKDIAIDIYEPLCYTADASKEILDKLSNHAAALDHYKKKEWGKAETLFRELQKNDTTGTGLYEVYLERIRNFQVIPPTSGWDGTHTLEGK